MVELQSLEIDGGADDDQLDLFYLVDRVLDEINEANALKKRQTDEDEIPEIMPTADTDDIYNTDLMDQIESAMSPFDDGSQYPHGFCDLRSSHSNDYQTIPQAGQNFADDLVEQIDMDNEYLSCVAKDNSCMPSYSYANKNSANVEVHTRDMVIPEDILHSAIALQNFTKTSRHAIDNLSSPVNDSASDHGNIDSDGHINKDYYKNFDELQKYSDLIQLPDMASRYPSIASTSTQNEPVNYSQNQQSDVVIPAHQYFDEESNDGTASEFMGWTTIHPENWNGTDVLDWLYYTAEKHGVDCSLLRGEAFRTVTGKMLCTLNAQGFRNLDPFYGDFFHKMFRQLLSGLQFTLTPESSFSDQSFSYIESQSGCYSMATSPSDMSLHSVDVSSGQSSTHTSPNLNQQAERLGPYDFLYASASGSTTQQSDDISQVQATDKTYTYTLGIHPVNYTFDYQTPQNTVSPKSGFKAIARERYDTNGTPRRRPGRPRVKSVPTDEELQAQKDKKLKSQHLWEFIYDMLNNPMYNPTILKWENQNEGIFRFIQSESVAQLWGTLKSNENMTYEKLSRAMRHYYKRGILERVEGRRLVYKFSKLTLERMNQKKRPCYVIETQC